MEKHSLRFRIVLAKNYEKMLIEHQVDFPRERCSGMLKSEDEEEGDHILGWRRASATVLRTETAGCF